MIAGILCHEYSSWPVYYLLLSLLLALCTSFIWQARHLTDLLLLFIVFCCGQQISAERQPVPDVNAVYYLKSRCEEELTHRNYILSSGNQKFYLSSFYTDTLYQPGDSLYFYTRISSLSENSDPGEFSYARYLKHKKVHLRLLPVTEIRQHGHSGSVRFFFTSFRQHLLEKTAKLIKDTSCRQLVNALCLGFKNDMDPELQDVFITTGTVHLLSVSGLHTGAIYLLLLYLFRYTGLSKRGQELIVIPFLWCYACLTGLSPSVIRAATILTFITAGKVFYKTYTPLNAVAASAFLTLLFEPYTLYSLSFLMSYSAYTGILLLYPTFYHLPGKMPKYLSKIYACCCLTIAAQIPTLPISAFYFHTINIDGFLANIIAVPLATFLLYCSAISLSLPLVISTYLGPATELLSKMLIRFLHLIQPVMINVRELYPTPVTIILIYTCLILACLFIGQKKICWLRATCCCTALLIIYLCVHNAQLSSRQEIVVFHSRQRTTILLNYRGYYSVLKNPTSDPQKIQSYIHQNKLRPLPGEVGLLNSNLQWTNSLLTTGTDTVMIVSSADYHFAPCHTLIITENISPEKLYNPMPSSLPSLIITDGSNSSFNVRKWLTFCRNNHIPIYNTYEEGSFRLLLK